MNRVRLVLTVLVLAGAATPVRAQSWLVLEGIADGELWATDSGSTLLSRSNGHAAPAGQFQLFTGIDARRLQLFFMGAVEGGSGSDEGETEFYFDQLVLRLLGAPWAVLDVGKFPSPMGAFANRRLSTTNPLIGTPDGYPVRYPWGVQLAGTASRFDYRAALVTLPPTHEDYTPDPTPRLRPVLGGGITPVPQLRVGGSVTWGPYLNDSVAGDWERYHQRVLALDSRVSVGYFEFHGELGFSRFDVPTRPAPVNGVTYYLEGKQTWTPRFFTAARFERNDYPFIQPATPTTWRANRVDAYNAEVGIGVRADRRTLAKVSYRRLWWHIDPALRAFLRDGYALALQLGVDFDLKQWE